MGPPRLERSAKVAHRRATGPATERLRDCQRGGHAPPEHLWFLGNTDDAALRRADVYMLGSVLYEIATGQSITSMTLPYWRYRS